MCMFERDNPLSPGNLLHRYGTHIFYYSDISFHKCLLIFLTRALLSPGFWCWTLKLGPLICDVYVCWCTVSLAVKYFYTKLLLLIQGLIYIHIYDVIFPGHCSIQIEIQRERHQSLHQSWPSIPRHCQSYGARTWTWTCACQGKNLTQWTIPVFWNVFVWLIV